MQDFLKDWGEAYGKLKSILAYLQSYPGLLKPLELGEFVDPEELDEVQAEWIALQDRFSDRRERDFFRPYWVPVIRDSMDFYIDLSESQFPLFEVSYFFLEPRRWFQQPVFRDISELLLAGDKGFDAREIQRRKDEAELRAISGMFDERLHLAFSGRVETQSPDLKELGIEGAMHYSVDGQKLDISDAHPLLCGILPLEYRIELRHLDLIQGASFYELERVKSIRDLVFLIRHLGAERVAHYTIELPEYPDSAIRFRDRHFRMWFDSLDLLNEFILQINKLQVDAKRNSEAC